MDNYIRKHRKGKQLTMKELGAIVGASEVSISQYERGERNPDNAMLVRIAAALDCTIDQLLLGTGAAVKADKKQLLDTIGEIDDPMLLLDIISEATKKLQQK